MSHESSLVKPHPNGEHDAVELPNGDPAMIYGRTLRRQLQIPLLDRLFRGMVRDQRKYPRLVSPPLTAYLGSPGSSRPFAIADVSIGGFCMRADEFWSLGTVLTITLQSSADPGDASVDSITVPAMVVRRAEGEAGFAIALASEQSLLFPGFRVEEACNVHDQMKSFLARLRAPAPVPAAQITASAPILPILNREQKLLLLLESAKNHKLSQAWDEAVEEEAEQLVLRSASLEG